MFSPVFSVRTPRILPVEIAPWELNQWHVQPAPGDPGSLFGGGEAKHKEQKKEDVEFLWYRILDVYEYTLNILWIWIIWMMNDETDKERQRALCFFRRFRFRRPASATWGQDASDRRARPCGTKKDVLWSKLETSCTTCDFVCLLSGCFCFFALSGVSHLHGLRFLSFLLFEMFGAFPNCFSFVFSGLLRYLLSCFEVFWCFCFASAFVMLRCQENSEIPPGNMKRLALRYWKGFQIKTFDSWLQGLLWLLTGSFPHSCGKENV